MKLRARNLNLREGNLFGREGECDFLRGDAAFRCWVINWEHV
jgi:hypothetical protein